MHYLLFVQEKIGRGKCPIFWRLVPTDLLFGTIFHHDYGRKSRGLEGSSLDMIGGEVVTEPLVLGGMVTR